MSLVPARFLVRVAHPCRHVKKMPREDADALLDLPASCRLDNFAALDSRDNFADVRLAWNEGGLALQVDVRGKDQPVTGLCVKWFRHEPGHESGDKPVSEGRSASILVTENARFEIDFCLSADFSGEVRTVVLRREGDFAVWGEGLYHRWRCVERATIATVRWTPQ